MREKLLEAPRVACAHPAPTLLKEEDDDLLLHCAQCQQVIRRPKPKQRESRTGERKTLLG